MFNKRKPLDSQQNFEPMPSFISLGEAIEMKRNTPSVKRKKLETALVQLITDYKNDGLDIVDVSFHINGSMIDVSVTINETTNTQAETTGKENDTKD